MRLLNFVRASLVTLLVALTACNGQDAPPAQDANIFTDLWSTLTQSGKTPSCPGECVHAITSIFCDHVLEEVSCGNNYMRCCVPNDFSHGTPVETSPPLGHEIDSLYSVTDDPQSNVTRPMPVTVTSRPATHFTETSTFSSTTRVTPPRQPVTESTSTLPSTTSAALSSKMTTERYSTTERTTSTTTLSPSMHPKCPGVCVKKEYARFCGNIMSNGECETSDEACCLQSEKDSVNLTSPFSSSAHQAPQKSLVSVAPLSYPDTKVQNPVTESDIPKQEVPSQPSPDCDGTCVAPLFSLLCDEVDHDKFCPNGGTCCLNKEPTTTPPPPEPCPGTCIPTFLSGVCNRPSELILKTADCFSGTICCKTPKATEEPDRDPEPQNHNKHDFSESQPPPMILHPPNRPNPMGPPMLFSQKPQQMPYNPQPYPYAQRPPMNRPPFGMPPFTHPNPPQRPPQMYPPNMQNVQMPPQPYPPPTQQINLQVLPTPPKHESPIQERPDNMFTNLSGDEHNEESIAVPSPEVGAPIFCPGPCISPMLKFTCFGASAIHTKFHCSSQGQVCCAPLAAIQAFENASPPVIASPDSDEHPAQPPPPMPSTTIAPVVIPVSTTLATTTTAPSTILPSLPVKPPPRKSNPYSCGVKGTQRRESPRIVGGSDAQPGEWCWQIALINAQNQYLCGGALIGTQWVVTAAHCITNLVRSSEEIFIRVGDYDLTNTIVSKSAQTRKVSTTYIHHNHNGQTLDNDIALLKMESPVEQNEAVCLVCLPARGSNRKPGKKCTVTGYGYTSESGPIALKVREAAVPVVDDQACTNKINAVTEKLFILPASSFCAGGTEGNDACQGDGGGPLVCEQEGFYELSGLVSWGFGCGRPDVPAVYVKVSSFIGWINQIISVNNNN